jgi:hypothetical protein
MERRISFPVGVVVERRKGVTKWADHVWQAVSVFAGRAPQEGWHEMRSGDGWTQFCAGTYELELHRSYAEDYERNLASPRPSLYVVLTPARGDVPWRVHLVTASPSEGEVYTISDETNMSAVPIAPEIHALIAAFTDAHFKPRVFKKRRREKTAALEEHKFGKDPIFARSRRDLPEG